MTVPSPIFRAVLVSAMPFTFPVGTASPDVFALPSSVISGTFNTSPMSGCSSGVFSGLFSGVFSGFFSVVFSGFFSGFFSGVFSSFFSGVFSGFSGWTVGDGVSVPTASRFLRFRLLYRPVKAAVIADGIPVIVIYMAMLFSQCITSAAHFPMSVCIVYVISAKTMSFCRAYHILRCDFCCTTAVGIPSSTVTDINRLCFPLQDTLVLQPAPEPLCEYVSLP